MAIQRVSVAERRARLGIRHHLAASSSKLPADVADDIIGFHATDPASVYLSAWARIDGLTQNDVARDLYDDRTLIRMLGMRRTMFVVPTTLAGVIQHSSSDFVATKIGRTYLKELSKAGVAGPSGDEQVAESWIADVKASVLRILAEQGDATGVQLSKAEPRLRAKVTMAEGKKYGGEISITSWVLNWLSAEGHIVRGRPGGSWTGSQYRWSSMSRWLPDGMPEMTAEGARAELVRRWLASFGPAPVSDIKWWTGWNLGDVKRALSAVDHVEVDLDGRAGIVLADDVELVDPPQPWTALLPTLDATPMGWQLRDWYIDPDHREQVFDRNGNIGPTVWADGRIVGGWAQRKDGEIVYRLFDDIGADQVGAIEAAAHRLADWHGDVRVTPRFRTPLEKELTSR